MTGIRFKQHFLKAHFVTIFLGVNLTFFPQHFLGLAGIPRRYLDFKDSFTNFNNISRLGRLLSVASLLVFLTAVVDRLVEEKAGRPTFCHFTREQSILYPLD